MSLAVCDVDRSTLGLHTLEQYAPLIGAAAVERISNKANRLRTQHLVHVSSTFYGGGVAEILTRMVPLMNEVGLATTWDVIEGDDDFFRVTKGFHNAIQGMEVELTSADFDAYLRTNRRNAEKVDLYASPLGFRRPARTQDGV